MITRQQKWRKKQETPIQAHLGKALRNNLDETAFILGVSKSELLRHALTEQLGKLC